MKILAIGNSITLGLPGISYVEFLKSYEVDNFGKAGDTITGIYNRLLKIEINNYDLILIEGGGNDILLPIFYEERPLWRKVINNIINSGSEPVNDIEEYILIWNNIYSFCKSRNLRMIVISNPVLGEDINTTYNKIVIEFNNKLKIFCKNNKIEYIDFFSWQAKNLSGNSKLMTNTPVDVEKDGYIKNIEEIDKLSKQRNYSLTIDGVHFNSFSARTLANMIKAKIINE
jgi:lysophospholipase L1-like esterase